MKDLRSRNMIARCNSAGPLYHLRLPGSSSSTFVATTAPALVDLWHRRLGHPGHEALSRLDSCSSIQCNKTSSQTLSHACQLGRHIHLPFSSSSSRAIKNFDLIHYDLWMSPVASISGYKYYLVILDDCSHFLCFHFL